MFHYFKLLLINEHFFLDQVNALAIYLKGSPHTYDWHYSRKGALELADTTVCKELNYSSPPVP